MLIQYVGEASDFSWVVPVPGVPELSTGSDVLFQSLEQATRPQFNLEIDGESCSDFGSFQTLGGLVSNLTFLPEDKPQASNLKASSR